MLAIGMAAKIMGVCVKTMRRWSDDGKIKCFRTIGGHRRFPMQELMRIRKGKEVTSDEIESKCENQKCALYGRVSTYKQKKRGDLEVQIEAMKEYCSQQGYSISGIYKDMGSGLNTNRRAMWRLINDAKKGCFSKVVLNYKDRLTRFGFRYLEEYLKEFNVEIIVINKLKSKSMETELVEDLVAIIQSFSGRLYGLRSHINKKTAASARERRQIKENTCNRENGTIN